MKFIISPAKTMNVDTDTFAPQALPRFLEQAEELKNYLQSLDYAACKALWNCSDALAEANFERLQKMDLHRSLTPALFAYEGIQYQYPKRSLTMCRNICEFFPACTVCCARWTA